MNEAQMLIALLVKRLGGEVRISQFDCLDIPRLEIFRHEATGDTIYRVEMPLQPNKVEVVEPLAIEYSNT